MKVLAIDLGGTHATCAMVEDRQVLRIETLHLPDSNKLGPLLGSLADCLRRVKGADAADGIGLGFCGLVNARSGRIASTNEKFEDALELDLVGWARDSLGLPLRIENDARLALLGEQYAGAAEGATDVVMFTLGTGIGGVAMMDNRLLKGKHGQAGTLGGHVPVAIPGRRCTCGGFGCAESEASGWSLPLVCREWPGFSASRLAQGPIDFKSLFEAADAEDRVACEVVDHCLRVWGAAAIAAIHAFDPELLVFGGGVMKRADRVLPFLEQSVARAWTPWGKVQVRAARLGDKAALIGAIPLFQQEN